MWDERYATDDYVFGTAPNAFLVDAARYLPAGGRVLAVADGEGRNGVWLAQQGFDVVSVDGSAVALDKARRLAAARGASVRFEQVDLLNWDWPQAAYDAVVAIFIQFAGPPDQHRLLRGLAQALRPGGVLLLQGYRPEQLANGTGGPPWAENMYTEALLRATYGDLECLHLRSHDTVIEEGTGHSGLSALIDLVARKPGRTTGEQGAHGDD